MFIKKFYRYKISINIAVVVAFLCCSCLSNGASYSTVSSVTEQSPDIQATLVAQGASLSISTPFPTRPVYAPGELVDYVAQTGDTLPNLAARFNTTIEEILEANSFIPKSATTMPPGMPMKIPIYYMPFWGNSYQIIPDHLFVNGPEMVKFDTSQFVSEHPGWFKGYTEYAAGANRTGADIVNYVALKFSVSPILFLTLLEYHSQALSNPDPSETALLYPLGYQVSSRQGLYRQLLWTANTLNNGYYGWRTNHLLSIEFEDGRIERFDPWQNAATVALHYYFSLLLSRDEYQNAIGSEGLAKVYRSLFGDPWSQGTPHIPGSLEQPAMNLPFLPGYVWAYTGGPHTGWGTGEPFAAIDFAPPSTRPGCYPTTHKATAVASGVVVRSDIGEVVIDLDGDGDERTGWNIFYLHVATEGRVSLESVLKSGEPIGYPSCEGGTSTGTHIHIARKYNGEWIPAEGPLAFNLEGWIAHNGNKPYLGTLTRGTSAVIACVCSNAASFIESGVR